VREVRLVAARRRTPEQETAAAQSTAVLTQAIDRLPPRYRTFLMLRSVEGLSVEETADVLNITEVNVRVRLNRGRALLRRILGPDFDYTRAAPFQFDDTRCDRIVAAVFRRISEPAEATQAGSSVRLRYP
jgi:RNA polymerase sigma-70 factor, ECF subfamily